MLVSQISLYYLKSNSIGNAYDEIRSLPLSETADHYLKCYNAKPKIEVDMKKAKKALELLVPFLGPPFNYESADVRPRQPARVMSWTVKGLGQAIRAVNYLAKEDIPCSISKRTLRIAFPLNCYARVLMKSDDPAYWVKEGNRKVELAKKAKKVRSVVKALDRR